MVSLTPSNKAGDTNISIKYGGISCWLGFCSSGYSEENFWTSCYSGDSAKISSVIIVLNGYTQRNNRKSVLFVITIIIA